jgi:hypothetical protein
MNQITDHILMVRPARFGFNPETAQNNAFQENDSSQSKKTIWHIAQDEFDELANRLQAAGIEVIIYEDTPEPPKPDAVFPNNWISFHQNGYIITYPINAISRRLERREDLVADMMGKWGYNSRLSLESYEDQNLFLEGTGSVILDRIHRIAYACKSVRTDETVLDKFCKIIDYTPTLFHAVDGGGLEIYHTNVMMALGESFVIICMDSIKDGEERKMLLEKFRDTQKEVIEISLEQMMAFAGNMLQVRNKKGSTYLVMSEQAYQSLSKEQIDKIEKHTNILYSPIDTIEKYGGGGVRCMMAEVFLPS